MDPGYQAHDVERRRDSGGTATIVLGVLVGPILLMIGVPVWRLLLPNASI